MDTLKVFTTVKINANTAVSSKNKKQAEKAVVLMECFNGEEFQSCMECICTCKDISVKLSSLATMLRG